jgi:cysteine desulfurase
MREGGKAIYMDHAATTAVDSKVVEAMLPYFTQIYGNASSIHAWGRAASEAIESARKTVADILGVRPPEVVFTSCGTESDNLAIRGVAFASRAKGNHIITSAIDRLNVDLLSLSAHKFYGPKGVGILYRRPSTPLLPMQTGGGHEGGWRAGTENTPYIVGLAAALKLAQEHRDEENARIAALRDRLIDGVLEAIPKSQLTGHRHNRLPNSASFVFQGVEAESILLKLDMLGVAGSSGSACTTGEPEPSHVLTAMGLPVELCHSSLRLTLGRENTVEDVDYVISALPEIVAGLRAMSPLYKEEA